VGGYRGGFPFWMELTAAGRMMTSLPLFHINAPAYSVMGALACGAGLVLLERFSASDFLAAARRHGATEFNAIGAMLEILMRQPAQPGDADTPLRLCYTGPASEQERSWTRSCPGSGGHPPPRTARVAKHRLPGGHPPGEYDAGAPPGPQAPAAGSPTTGETQ
jgi:acyl-CoA synthetase (AMP-forming)/AMP-acid ligase II